MPIDTRNQYHIYWGAGQRLLKTVTGVREARQSTYDGDKKYVRVDHSKIEDGRVVIVGPPRKPEITREDIALLADAIEGADAWKGALMPEDFEGHDKRIEGMRAALKKISNYQRVGEIVIAPENLLGGGFHAIRWDAKAPALPVGTVVYIKT